MKCVGILGCGWLGVPLGLQLKKENWSVRGSRRSSEGVLFLKEKGIDSYPLKLLTDRILGNPNGFFKELDILLISVPPNRKEPKLDLKINYLLSHLKTNALEKIVFLSSTSVYGKSGGEFDEKSPPNPVTASAEVLVQCENLILDHPIPSLIIRLGGLIGPDRNPIFSLQNKAIPNPNGNINFITQIDAVSGIRTLLADPLVEGIFNLVNPDHPNRRIYYETQSKKHGLPNPSFREKDETLNRIIKGDKISSLTSFQYTIDNLLI
jgi:nucleoside-diphosphate-sugar epimerase